MFHSKKEQHTSQRAQMPMNFDEDKSAKSMEGMVL
jgi:hypothetical protein